jgi:Skp family chaperone for outer membrane proteins
MLMDQMQQMYSTWDAVGRSNFEYDYLVELVGVDKAERYAGKPNETRLPYDHKIATLENLEMLEGDVINPVDGENHMVHLPVHIDELEAGLQGVDEGQVDIMQYTMQHKTIYEHCVATLEMTTVHETVQPELNQYKQRIQQIGEIVMNGLKMINKQNRENDAAAQNAEMQQGQEVTADQKEQQKLQQELQMNDLKHKQKLQQEFQNHSMRLQMIKESGQQKMVMQAQDAMSKIASRDAEVQQRMARLRASSI